MRLLKNRTIAFYLSLIIILALAISGAAISVFADSGPGTATANVTGGSLSEISNFASASANATLTGSNQTVPYTLPITVTDATGSGSGWNLTIQGTALTCTSGTCSGNSNAPTLTQQVSLATSACANQGTCTNIVSTKALGLPFNVTNTATKFFEADANSGMGIFTVTTTVNILIPGNAYAGSYSGSVTIASVSGP